MKWLATWIMNRIAGDGSSDWALAMRREFDELEEGHLGWALGSLGTVIATDVRTNWRFLASILLACLFLNFYYGRAVFELAAANLERSIFREYFYAISILSPLPIPFLLGYLKPGRAMTIAVLGGFVGVGVGGTLVAMSQLGGSFYTWWVDAMWMDTFPVWLGAIVTAGIWFVCAWLGGAVREYRGRTRSA